MFEDQVVTRGKRNEAKERKWRGVLREFRRSGQSVREFCRERRLTEASFYRWRQIVGRRDAEPSRAKTSSARVPGLAPVVMVEEVCRDKKKESEKLATIEIVLCGGTMVRISNDATREQLGMVLDALERSRC